MVAAIIEDLPVCWNDTFLLPPGGRRFRFAGCGTAEDNIRVLLNDSINRTANNRWILYNRQKIKETLHTIMDGSAAV